MEPALPACIHSYVEWMSPGGPKVHSRIEWMPPGGPKVHSRIEWMPPGGPKVHSRIEWMPRAGPRIKREPSRTNQNQTEPNRTKQNHPEPSRTKTVKLKFNRGFYPREGRYAVVVVEEVEVVVVLRVKSPTPDYQGFRVAFAAPGIPKTSIYGGASYKAGFKLIGVDWQLVEIPLTQFSYDWSGYTGRCDTKDPASRFAKSKQHYCCSKSGQQPSKPEVCVNNKLLSKTNTFILPPSHRHIIYITSKPPAATTI